MQETFVFLLIAVLTGAIVSIVVLGVIQVRRSRRLSTLAYQKGMHFSVDDPFGIPIRYGMFSLVISGHSCRAHNVTHGYIDSVPVRAFDFHYEVGHATRRAARQYSVIVVDMPFQLPDLLLWHKDDLEAAPVALAVQPFDAGRWLGRGDQKFSRSLVQYAKWLDQDKGSVECCQSQMMIALPLLKQSQNYMSVLGQMQELVHELRQLYQREQ